MKCEGIELTLANTETSKMAELLSLVALLKKRLIKFLNVLSIIK